MKIIKFDITNNGTHLCQTPIREQAMNFAKTYAKKNNTNVSVVAYFNDGRSKKVIVKESGEVDKVWQNKIQ